MLVQNDCTLIHTDNATQLPALWPCYACMDVSIRWPDTTLVFVFPANVWDQLLDNLLSYAKQVVHFCRMKD